MILHFHSICIALCCVERAFIPLDLLLACINWNIYFVGAGRVLTSQSLLCIKSIALNQDLNLDKIAIVFHNLLFTSVCNWQNWNWGCLPHLTLYSRKLSIIGHQCWNFTCRTWRALCPQIGCHFDLVECKFVIMKCYNDYCIHLLFGSPLRTSKYAFWH